MEAQAPQRPHVGILASPGMGHLIPLVELARKLVQLNTNFTVTLYIPDDGSSLKPEKALLQSLHHLPINSIFLPPQDHSINLHEVADALTRMVLSVTRSLPALRDSLISESTRVSAFVVDMFGLPSMDVVKKLGIPFYVFFLASAMSLSFVFHLPELHESCTCAYRDLPEPVKLPGCVRLKGSDFVDPVQDRKHETYKGFLGMSQMLTLVDGILVNSFLDLEPNTFKAFEQSGSCNKPPIYPIGPLIRPGSEYMPDCLKWLDEQAYGSVLFVSFGSGGTLSKQQLKELALGLEMSERGFLFVARRPNEAKDAAYFTDARDQNKIDDPFDYLPPNFMEMRTKGKGFVVSEWAPQIEVLSHPAVGGFLTHCGWNSTLESIANGMPLIAWPLFAEQKMNAVLLSQDLKVAFRVKENENGVVESEQIAKLVKSLIGGKEGEELRNRVKNLKEAAAKALSQDGSSCKCLANVTEKWINET